MMSAFSSISLIGKIFSPLYATMKLMEIMKGSQPKEVTASLSQIIQNSLDFNNWKNPLKVGVIEFI